MKTQTDLWVCVDCYMVYHYGLAQYEPSEGWDIDAATQFYDEYGFQAISDNWSEEDGHIEFSKASCDICQSHLAGRRYRFALTEDE